MIRIALCALFGGLLPAAELTIADIPLTVGTAPVGYRFEIDNGTTTVAGTDAVDQALTVRLGLRMGFPGKARSSGPVVGVELGADQYDLGNGTDRRFGLNALAGWGWAPADHVALVLSGVAGLGYGRLELDASDTNPGFSGDGRATTFGLRLATVVNLSRRWLAEIDLGWETIDHRVEADGVSVRLRPAGVTTGLGLTYRFDPMPVRLE